MENAVSKKFPTETMTMYVVSAFVIAILAWTTWDYSQRGGDLRFAAFSARCHLGELQNAVVDCLKKNGWAEKEAVQGCLASVYECAQVETAYSMAPEDQGIVSIRITRHLGTLVIRFRPDLVSNIEAKDFTALDLIKDSL